MSEIEVRRSSYVRIDLKKNKSMVKTAEELEFEVDGQAKSYFSCQQHNQFQGTYRCPICVTQIKQANRFQEKPSDHPIQSEPYFFQHLIKDLIPDLSDPNERLIKGCQVFLPETVFFSDGRIDFLATMDKDFCLTQDTKLKLQNLEVRTRLENIVKERFKDTETFGREQAYQRKQCAKNNSSMQVCNSQVKGLSMKKAESSTMTQKTRREERNQALVIVKYKELDETQGMSEVISEKELQALFEHKPNSKDFNWKSVQQIQTCVKDQYGIGKQLVVQFQAQVVNDQAVYDVDQYQPALTLLMSKQYQKYCEKQCHKIGYYLQKVRGIEVLSMKCEFLRDENNNIWLSYISDIQIRRQQGCQIKAVTQEMPVYQQQHQQQLKAELQQDHQVGSSKMLLQMDAYYEHMKKDLQVDPNYVPNDEDKDLEKALLDSKANVTPCNFKLFLSRKHNFNKNTVWKQIARRLDDDVKRLSIVKEAGRVSETIKSNQIGGIGIQNQDMELQKFIGGVKAFQSFLPPKPQPSHLKQISNLKGDLISRSLVNRQDLMKLYQAPQKKSQVIENNPFYNQQILSSTASNLSDTEKRQEALNFINCHGRGGIFFTSQSQVTLHQKPSKVRPSIQSARTRQSHHSNE